MNGKTAITEFLQAYMTGDANTLEANLADGFIFEDPTAPTPLNKETFIDWSLALGAAFPDLDVQVSDVHVDGDTVTAVLTASGFQEGRLDLAVFGLDALPAVGVGLDLAPQPVRVRLQNGRITACAVRPQNGAGVGAIIDQISNVVAIA